MEQQLVSFVTLYPYLTPLDFLPNGDVKPANQIPIAFVLTDTIPNKKQIQKDLDYIIIEVMYLINQRNYS